MKTVSMVHQQTRGKVSIPGKYQEENMKILHSIKTTSNAHEGSGKSKQGYLKGPF